MRTRGDYPQRQATIERLLRGDLFAGTANERSGGASGSASTTLRRNGDGYRLDGEEYYSTGGVYAQWFSGNAVDEDGATPWFTVPVDRQGVELLDDFDAVGQRLTASGTTRLIGVPVNRDEIVYPEDAPPANPWQGAFAQLYLSTIEAGIAATVLDDAAWFVREKARPIKHSTADKSVDDPYVRRVVGQIAARAHAPSRRTTTISERGKPVPQRSRCAPNPGWFTREKCSGEPRCSALVNAGSLRQCV